MNDVTRHRWNIVGRSLLASIGGFLLISAVGGCLAIAFAALGLMPMAQAVHVLTLAGFVAWCGVAMWVFAAGSLGKVTLQIVFAIVVALGTAFFFR